MKTNIIAASILAAGLIVATILHTGRYYVLAVESGVVIKVDRWTGKIKMICSGPGWTACDDAEFARIENSN